MELPFSDRMIHPSGITGSLRRKKDNWFRLGIPLPPVVVDILQGGAPLLFREGHLPPPRIIPQRPLSAEHTQVLEEWLQEAIHVHRDVEELSSPPLVSSPVFVLPRKTPGRFRVIIDLRYVNRYQIPPRFRQESLDTVAKMIEPGDWLTSLDIKEGFKHVEIRPQHRKYLGFRVGDRWYQFRGMPFGSSTSPWIFAKALRPLVAKARAEGIRIVIYVDDAIIMARSQEESRRHTARVVELLVSLGWHVSTSKSVLEPTQCLEYLGHLVDTTRKEPRFRIPYAKKRDVCHQLRRMIRASFKGPVIKRAAARLAGKCTALVKAAFPTQVLVRNLLRCLKQPIDWDGKTLLTAPAVMDLIELLRLLQDWDGQLIIPRCPDLILETDSSGFAWGAHIVGQPDSQAGAMFPPELAKQHINLKELTAIRLGLEALKDRVAGKSVLLHTDSTVCVHYILRMTGRIPELAAEARRIWEFCRLHQVELRAIHKPGVQNEVADHLSRVYDKNTWGIRKETLQRLESQLGRHSIDLFADQDNALLPRFVSRHWVPGAVAANAFSFDWRGETPIVCPPIKLLGQVVDKMVQERITGTVIAPVWRSMPWFHRLQQASVKSIKLYPEDFHPDKQGRCLPTANPGWQWKAFRISPH